MFVLAFVSLIDSLTSGKMPPVCKPPQTFVCNKIRTQHCLLGQHIRLATVRRSTSTQFGGASHSMGARGTGGGDDTSPAAKRAWSFPESPCAGRKRRRTHVGNICSISVRVGGPRAERVASLQSHQGHQATTRAMFFDRSDKNLQAKKKDRMRGGKG